MRSSIQKNKLSVYELTVFSMLGAIMFISKFIMEVLPSIHLLALLLTVITLTYRIKALVPLYVYIFIDGTVYGFSMWWIPYLYIWLPLWGIVMLVSKINMPRKIEIPVYMLVCALHGISYGTLYAPAQALMFGLNYEAMIAWIIAGLPFDTIQAISNFCAASLVIPLYTILKKLKRIYK